MRATNFVPLFILFTFSTLSLSNYRPARSQVSLIKRPSLLVRRFYFDKVHPPACPRKELFRVFEKEPTSNTPFVRTECMGDTDGYLTFLCDSRFLKYKLSKLS